MNYSNYYLNLSKLYDIDEKNERDRISDYYTKMLQEEEMRDHFFNTLFFI